MNSAVRRTGTYFHSLACWSAPTSVRAPQTTLPMTGNVRRALMPSGLRAPLSASLTAHGEADPADGGLDARRRLPDAAGGIGPRVDAGDDAAGPDVLRPPVVERVGHREPRVVERGVLARREPPSRAGPARRRPSWSTRAGRPAGTRARASQKVAAAATSAPWSAAARDAMAGMQRMLKTNGLDRVPAPSSRGSRAWGPVRSRSSADVGAGRRASCTPSSPGVPGRGGGSPFGIPGAGRRRQPGGSAASVRVDDSRSRCCSPPTVIDQVAEDLAVDDSAR